VTRTSTGCPTCMRPPGPVEMPSLEMADAVAGLLFRQVLTNGPADTARIRPTNAVTGCHPAQSRPLRSIEKRVPADLLVGPAALLDGATQGRHPNKPTRRTTFNAEALASSIRTVRDPVFLCSVTSFRTFCRDRDRLGWTWLSLSHGTSFRRRQMGGPGATRVFFSAPVAPRF
jgi:hypothetical protein